MPLSPSRTTGWSSAISSRIGAPVAPLMRRLRARPGRRPRWPCRRPAPTRPGACRTGPRSAAASRPGRTRRPARPRPYAAAGIARARPGRGPVEAAAVVAHVQRDLVLHVGQGQPDPGRPARAWRRWPAPPAPCAAARPRPPAASAVAVPVVVTWTAMPCSADQRSATPASASLSRAASSGSGRSACTDRRASDRLSRASAGRRLNVPAPRARVVGRPARPPAAG